MSFGSPTPVEVAVQGTNMAANRVYAQTIRGELAKIPELRDLRLARPLDYPTLDITIRSRPRGPIRSHSGGRRALHSRGHLLQPFHGTELLARSGERNGFQIQVEIPQDRIQPADDVRNIPVMKDGRSRPLLGDVASVANGTAPGMVERYNMQRVVSYTANVHGEPLGRLAEKVREALKRAGESPRGMTVGLRQIPVFEETFRGLRTGLLLSMAAIFPLLAANFQSFRLSALSCSRRQLLSERQSANAGSPRRRSRGRRESPRLRKAGANRR